MSAACQTTESCTHDNAFLLVSASVLCTANVHNFLVICATYEKINISVEKYLVVKPNPAQIKIHFSRRICEETYFCSKRLSISTHGISNCYSIGSV
jgi:hypothetical protein